MMRLNEEGFTLLEVLIAIVVFSFGLLGIAGMMTISVRNNHNGYLRSQANFLAENMMDRMRANPTALWSGKYDGTPTAPAVAVDKCKLSDPCDYDELAEYDMEQWAQSIELALPDGEGTISCVNSETLPSNMALATPPSIWFPAPPYRGICTITVEWNEANRDSAKDNQVLELVAQP
jgi:type IV pilus assembly protein PilV